MHDVCTMSRLHRQRRYSNSDDFVVSSFVGSRCERGNDDDNDNDDDGNNDSGVLGGLLTRVFLKISHR